MTSDGNLTRVMRGSTARGSPICPSASTATLPRTQTPILVMQDGDEGLYGSGIANFSQGSGCHSLHPRIFMIKVGYQAT